MTTQTDDKQAAEVQRLASMICQGGVLEHEVEQLADVLHIWRTAPLPERRFLQVDAMAAEQILLLIRQLRQPRGAA